MSVKYIALDASHNMFFTFLGRTNNKSLPGRIEINTKNNFQFNFHRGEPLETIAIMLTVWIQHFKCLTFFSEAQSGWKNFQAQILEIAIRMNTYSISKLLPYFFLFIIYRYIQRIIYLI